MSKQINLIEFKPAELYHIPLGELKERTKIVGAPATAALVRAIGDGNFEDALHLSVKPDGTYIIRAGNGRLDALIRAEYDDDYQVPCFVREWTGPEDALYLLSDHAVQRQNVIAEYLAVRELAGVLTEKEIARRTGLRLDKVRSLVVLDNMHPELLEAFMAGDIAASVATRIARRPMEEQRRANGLYQETGELRGKNLDGLRKVASQSSATTFKQTEMFDDFRPLDAFIQGDDAYVTVPGQGRFKVSGAALLEFLAENNQEEEEGEDD